MMHPLDAELVRRGEAKRPMSAAPGIHRRLLYGLFVANAPGAVEAADVEVDLTDGMEVPGVEGLRVIHTPGHTAGHIALLWVPRHILIAGDAASNMLGLGVSLGYEDLRLGLRSLATLSALDFDIACFGHGGAITANAAWRFSAKWRTASSAI